MSNANGVAPTAGRRFHEYKASPTEMAADTSKGSMKGVYCQFILLVLLLSDYSSLSSGTRTGNSLKLQAPPQWLNDAVHRYYTE